MAGKSKLQEILERELAANRWHWWTRIRFDQTIAAVLFRLSLPAACRTWRPLRLLSFSNVYQAGANREALALLNHAMKPLYSDPAQIGHVSFGRQKTSSIQIGGCSVVAQVSHVRFRRSGPAITLRTVGRSSSEENGHETLSL